MDPIHAKFEAVGAFAVVRATLKYHRRCLFFFAQQLLLFRRNECTPAIYEDEHSADLDILAFGRVTQQKNSAKRSVRDY